VVGWLLVQGQKLLPGQLVGLAACEWGSCCYVSANLRTETLGVRLEIRGNMGQCKSKERDFKD
jgi:hypothetical protein